MCGWSCKGCNITRRAFLGAGAGFALAAAGCGNIGQTELNMGRDNKTKIRKEAEDMDNLKFVTYCGLYCELCGNHGRIPQQAKTLRDSLAKEGYDNWGKEIPGFEEFWKFLLNLSDPDKNAPGCRQGCGAPFCSIRKCAREKKIDVCVFCEEYPCKRVLGIAKGYPKLIADGKRMKEVGIETWLREQRERAKTGFAYCDIRYYPYTVPKD